MACSLNTVATIDDISRIRAVLLPHLLEAVSDNDHPTTDTDLTEDDEGPSEITLLLFDRINSVNMFFFSLRKCCSNSCTPNHARKKEEESIGWTSSMAS